MRCPNCQKELPENARFCPICGASMDDYTQKVRPAVETEEATVRSDNPIFVNVPEEAPVPQKIPVPEETPVSQEVPVPEEVPAEPEAWTPDVEAVPMQLNVSGEEQPVKKEKKPKKKKLIVGITAIVLAVALIVTGLLGFLVFDWGLYIRDFFERQKDPVEYKTIVEERALAGGSVTELNLIKSWLMESYDGMVELGQKGGQESTVTLTMDEDLRSLLKLATAGEEELNTLLNNLQQIDVKFSQNFRENAHQLKVTIGANEVDILSMDMILDRQTGKVYAAAPELNGTYLQLEAVDEEDPTYALANILHTLDETMELYRKLPARKDVEKALDSCILKAMACIKDVKKSETTLKASGISQDVTVLTYRIDQKTMKQMALSVLDAVEKEPALKALAEGFNMLSAEEGQPLDLEAARKSLEEKEATDELILKIDTYVNHKGQIVGRSIEPVDSDAVMEYVIVNKGKDIGIRVELFADQDEILLEGKGVWENDALQADIAMVVNGEETMVLKCNNLDIKTFRGKVSIRLGETLKESIRESVQIPMNAVDLGELRLDLDMKKNVLNMTLGAGSMDALFVNSQVVFRQAQEVQLPEKSSNNMYLWAMGLRLDTVQQNLKDANLEIVAQLLQELALEMAKQQLL